MTSRCAKFRFRRISDEAQVVRLKHICDLENITYGDGQVSGTGVACYVGGVARLVEGVWLVMWLVVRGVICCVGVAYFGGVACYVGGVACCGGVDCNMACCGGCILLCGCGLFWRCGLYVGGMGCYGGVFCNMDCEACCGGVFCCVGVA